MSQGICEKLLGPSVIFRFYLLRTSKREQHRNGNKKCVSASGKEALSFLQKEKDLVAFFAYKLPLKG